MSECIAVITESSAKAMGSCEAGMSWRAAWFEVSMVTRLIPLSSLSSLASQRPSSPPQLLIMALSAVLCISNCHLYMFGEQFWSLCQDFTFVFYKCPSPFYFWCFKENVSCALKLRSWIRKKNLFKTVPYDQLAQKELFKLQSTTCRLDSVSTHSDIKTQLGSLISREDKKKAFKKKSPRHVLS